MSFNPFTSTPTIAQLAAVAQRFLDLARLYHRVGGKRAFGEALHAEAALWMCVYHFPMAYLVGQNADCIKAVDLIEEGSNWVRLPMETMPHAPLWQYPSPHCWKGPCRLRFDGRGIALIDQGLAFWERSLRSQRDSLREQIAGSKRRPRRGRNAKTNILQALGQDELQGPEIALKAGYEYNYIRRVLARMVTAGELHKTKNGYKRGDLRVTITR
jgi:hypothetical protein